MMVGTLKKSIAKPDVIMFLSPESISALQNTGQMASLYLSEVTLSEPRHRQGGDHTRIALGNLGCFLPPTIPPLPPHPLMYPDIKLVYLYMV